MKRNQGAFKAPWFLFKAKEKREKRKTKPIFPDLNDSAAQNKGEKKA